MPFGCRAGTLGRFGGLLGFMLQPDGVRSRCAYAEKPVASVKVIKKKKLVLEDLDVIEAEFLHL
jgi:hypothetical protein